eukprot:CAMPEP_0206216770 /NCGR_PEP_ID=MMETSP0047_2-20121206/2900_1 /ASSEMBLY_ACC=CAM_ASM_000192 /TAXON_ID=195065 /ORGANISM="Chroomonas mesostigmatica_cf, Strain CCMP1168" /LENGTH=256 /DNA_ID=CAMNT_0053639143 /DNA_START=101 /DNA_END=867 /DNA_ORIENTATION=+
MRSTEHMSEEGFTSRHWVQDMARGLRSAASDSASESGAAVSASDAEEMQEAARAKYANRHQQVLSQEEGVAQGLVEELDWDVLVSALHSKEAAAVMDFVHRYDLGIDRGNALLMLLQQEAFDMRALQGLTVQSLLAKLEDSQSALGCEMRTADLTDRSCDGPQTLTAHYLLSTAVMQQMFGDPNYKGKFRYEAMPTYNSEGVRTCYELLSGQYAQAAQDAVTPDCCGDLGKPRGWCGLAYQIAGGTAGAALARLGA